MEATQKSMPVDAASAVQQWRNALPDCLLPESELPRYQNNCLSLARRILAVIQPKNEADIIAAVRIANQYKVPLYTVSTGHNWGYGSSAPVTNDCAILDLSRMNKISGFDPETGLITLEPGVTQKQLVDYLAENHYDFYVPTTGAGPSASIVGNALEHGFGMTPDEDHFRGVTGLRAVLANGSIYASPAADCGSKNAGVWKWGVGPYLDGLFGQANMGIVTALQIALVPRPEHTEAFVFTLRQDASLEEMLEASRRLFIDMRGTVGGIKVLNRKQLESTIGTNKMGMSLASEFAWMGIGVFRSRKSMIPAIRKEIRAALGAASSRLVFINNRRNARLEKIFKLVPGKLGAKLRHQLERAQHLMDIMNGIPRGLELRLVYHFVTPPEKPIDPVADGVGILWYAPIIAMKTKLLLDMIAMIEEVLARHGFPPAVSFTTVGPACAIGVIPIIYDKPRDAEKAKACFHEFWDRGNALGCPPYRMNVEMMGKLTDPTHSGFWQTVDKIKTALDPNQILSPGRYSPTD